jgi:hypothetical protein
MCIYSYRAAEVLGETQAAERRYCYLRRPDREESTLESRLLVCGGFGRPSSTHSCCIACCGVSRVSGFQSSHRATKLRKAAFVFLHCSACGRVVYPGNTAFPRELGVTTISPAVSKNSFRLGEACNISNGGGPSTDAISYICSASLSPGNSGYPRNSSAKIHPNDHISICVVYGIPKMISGAR